MDIVTIKSMLNNSTWYSYEKNTSYEFFNGNSLSINGVNHLHYSIASQKDKIELQISSGIKYNVEFVNDFTLKLYNNNEAFRLMPE